MDVNRKDDRNANRKGIGNEIAFFSYLGISPVRIEKAGHLG